MSAFEACRFPPAWLVPLVFAAACTSAPRTEAPALWTPQPASRVVHPEWSRSATIYEMNVRQMTPEGTFRAAEAHLPRLDSLGVDIVWLMPIHPIGERNRKGTLGSPYSVRDYYGVNPEFGTFDDLRHFVDAAHARGMYVILDWVANHTAWDNPLVTEHPDWYDRDWKGDFRPTPWWDWSDIIDLDYRVPEVGRYMADALEYWVREADIDGYRADVAGFIPLDFWEHVRARLERVKPVFLLAEWEMRDMHYGAFDATYAWSWSEAVHDIAHGEGDVNRLYVYYSWDESSYPENAMRMTYVSNHDTNAWEGTQFELFGDALEPAIVLSVIGDGIPMLYSGQEAGYDHRLAFFERDPIVWREHWVGDLYRRLFALKDANSALHNAPWGALMVKVPNSDEARVLSFVRAHERDRVFAVFNLDDEARTVTFREALHHGEWTDYATGRVTSFDATTSLDMQPWSWRIFVAGGGEDLAGGGE